MARNLITTNILGSVKAPLTKAALDTLQANFKEVPASIARGVLGSYTTNDVIIWEGFTITITGFNTATWTAGTVYYNGEFYQVLAGTLTKATGSVFLYSIVDSLITAQFSDGNSYNWLETKTITITSGTSGTGIADYAAATVKSFSTPQIIPLTLINGYANLVGLYLKKDFLGNVSISNIGVGNSIITAPSVVTSNQFAAIPSGFTPATGLKSFIGCAYGTGGSGTNGPFCIIIGSGGNGMQIVNLDGTSVPANSNCYLDVVKYNVNF